MDSNAIDAARAALPGWVAWAGALFYPLVSFALAWLLARLLLVLAMPAPLRADLGAALHWSERARRLWGPRSMLLSSALVLPAFAAFVGYVSAGPMLCVPAPLLATLSALAALAPLLTLRWRFENALRGVSWSARDWLRSLASTLVVMVPHLALALLVAPFIPAQLTPRAVAVVAVALPSVFVLATGAGLFLALKIGLATEASAHVQSLVARTAASVGSAPKGVYVLPLAMANALAFPLWGRLAFTPAALAVLDDDALCAVCAHELGHLGESRAQHWQRAAAALLLGAPVMLLRPLVHAGGALAFYVPMGAAFVAMRLLASRARKNEERADHVAHAHQHEEGVYARALAALYEANVVPAVMGAKRVHPHLYDRMLAAKVDPGFERPTPPSIKRALMAFIAVAMLTGALAGFGATRLHRSRSNDESSLVRAVALSGGGGVSLGALAYARYERGDLASAIVFYRAEAVAEPRWVAPAAALVTVLARAGRCDEAERAMESTRERLRARTPGSFEMDRASDAELSLSRCRQGVPSAPLSDR